MEEIVLTRGLIYFICSIVTVVAFRRFIYSVLDPFLIFLLCIPSGIALSIGSGLEVYLVLTAIFFWIGMAVTTPHRVSDMILKNQTGNVIVNIKLLRVFTYLFCIFSIATTLLTFYLLGIPLFSDNPSEAKVAGFEGLGILRRVQFVKDICPIGLLLLIGCSLKKGIKKFDVVLLILLIVLSILSGSKSSVLNIVFLVYLILKVTPLGKIYYREKKDKFRKIIFFGGISSVAVLAFIVSVEAVREGGDFLYSLLYRLMEFGEVMIYYSDEAVQSFCARNYPYSHFLYDELNEIFGMLKLAPYNLPIGYNMVTEYWNGIENDVITGPNTVFYVKGHIYFGYVGGIIYSFFMGVIFAKVRNWYFKMRVVNVFKYAFATFLFFNLTVLLRESAMFFGMLFSLAIFSFPIYILSELYIKRYERQVYFDNNRSMECS